MGGDSGTNKGIPEGWCITTLADLFLNPKSEIVDGPFGSNLKASEYIDSGVPVLRIQNIERNLFLNKNIKHITPQKAEKLERHCYRPGDVILTKLGNPLGKSCTIPESFPAGIVVADLVRLRLSHDNLNKKFLVYAINSPHIAAQLKKLTKGTTRPRVNLGHVRGLKFKLPPKAEQHRIVAKIEKLFSELDKGVESLKAARAKLKVYRQSVLKHAFEGKLTAQWREENKEKLEKPEQLLARIKQEREARYEQQLQEWKTAVKKWEEGGKLGKKPQRPKKLFELKAVTSKELPTLSKGWSWFSLSSIASNIQTGPFGSLLHRAEYLVGGTPLVNPSHIRYQRIEPDRTLTVSAQKLLQLRKYVLQEGDIVIGRRGQMGRCAVVTATEAGWLCGTGSLFLRLLSSMNPQFFSWVLSSQRVKDFLAASSIGTTMRNLNEGILRRVPVPVCSRHEQDELVREIERQYSMLDHIEAAIDFEISKSATLRQTILKKAFSGHLVPQDSNDEPASVLLERIKAEKTARLKKYTRAKRRRTAAKT